VYAICGEMLELLLATHFPNSVVTEETVAPAPAHCAKLCDRQVAAEAVNSFAPCKSPGMDGIFPGLLQEGWRIAVPYMVRIFHACLVNGFQQGDALLLLLFSFVLEYASRVLQVNEDGLKLSGSCQLLIYTDDDNLLRRSILTMKKNRALVVAHKEIGLEVYVDKTKCMVIS
jgi:hypothetical protein